MGKNLEKEVVDFQLARGNYVGTLNKQRIEALNKGNAAEYFQLCNELCFEPENLSLYERGQMEATSYDLNNSTLAYKKRKVSKSTYLQFLKYVNEYRLKPWAISTDINQKRNLLKNIMGNLSLKTEEGDMPIGECSDGRIGEAFKNTYKSACRAVGLKY